MARNLTAGFISAATSSLCRPIVIFEGNFSGSTLRLWNGMGDLSWASNTWLGNGWFQGLEGGDESTEVEAFDMTVLLSGVPSSLVSLVLGSQKQGSTGAIWIGFLDSSRNVIADPYQWWMGYYSHAEIEYEATEATVRLFYDSPLVDMDRPNEGRWTHEFQQKLFSGDKGFEYVVATANWSGNWGQGRKESQNGKKPKRPHPSRGGRQGSKRK